VNKISTETVSPVGGSRLSSLGGSLRLGELRPGQGPRHALKLNVYGRQAFYGWPNQGPMLDLARQYG
jgi:hypothetical protein